jgi:hypothetical protein
MAPAAIYIYEVVKRQLHYGYRGIESDSVTNDISWNSRD